MVSILQKRVAGDRIDMPIIFITGYGDVPMTVQAMKAGAVEFLTKPFSDDVLLNAIRHAIERSQTALGHEAEIRTLRDCYASLSRREREVMALVVTGLLNKQVGCRARHQRDHGESTPRQGDAKNEGRLSRRPGDNGRETPSCSDAEKLTAARGCGEADIIDPHWHFRFGP